MKWKNKQHQHRISTQLIHETMGHKDGGDGDEKQWRRTLNPNMANGLWCKKYTTEETKVKINEQKETKTFIRRFMPLVVPLHKTHSHSLSHVMSDLSAEIHKLHRQEMSFFSSAKRKKWKSKCISLTKTKCPSKNWRSNELLTVRLVYRRMQLQKSHTHTHSSHTRPSNQMNLHPTIKN